MRKMRVGLKEESTAVVVSDMEGEPNVTKMQLLAVSLRIQQRRTCNHIMRTTHALRSHC